MKINKQFNQGVSIWDCKFKYNENILYQTVHKFDDQVC